MRNILIRILYGIAVFAVTVLILEMLPTGELSDVAVTMPEASFPLVRIYDPACEETGAYFNELHGYASERTLPDFMPCLTPVGPDRTVRFAAYGYTGPRGGHINSISYSIRPLDGSRLIQEGPLEFETAGDDGTVTSSITFGQLIAGGQDYLLAIRITMLDASGSGTYLEESPDIYYYTRIRCMEDERFRDRTRFVLNFHAETLAKDPGGTLVRYLETDESGKNDTPAHVTIHSDPALINYGTLELTEEMPAAVTMTDLQDNTASFSLDFLLTDGNARYLARENFLIMNGEERFYLLDYDRTMVQMFSEDLTGYEDGSIDLGIGSTDIPLFISGDGNVIAFENAGRLFGVSTADQSAAYIYGFTSGNTADRRELFNAHSVSILSADESGRISFLVTGYMNRGKHEGETGVLMMTYNPVHKTVEEDFFLPYAGAYETLMGMTARGVYLSSRQLLYLYIGDALCQIDVERRTIHKAVFDGSEDSVFMSDSGRYAAFVRNEDGTDSVTVVDLSDMSRSSGSCPASEKIVLFGFTGDDLVYGYSRSADAGEDMMGRSIEPVYRVCIADPGLKVLSDYRPREGLVSDAAAEEDAVALELIAMSEGSGIYTAAGTDRILYAGERAAGSRVTAAPGGRNGITVSRLKKSRLRYVAPKEVLYEGDRNILYPEEIFSDSTCFAAGMGNDIRYYQDLAEAVIRADEVRGKVYGSGRELLWRFAGKQPKEQIMSIQAASAEGDSSLAMCVNTVLEYEQENRDASELISSGEDLYSVLEELLPGRRIADLSGCSLDEVLYMVDKQMPVIARSGENDALVITGYNSEQIVVAVPGEAAVRFMDMKEAERLFTAFGSEYLSYYRTQ